jgi:hypothetical protein
MLGRLAVSDPELAYAELFLFVTPKTPVVNVPAAFFRVREADPVQRTFWAPGGLTPTLPDRLSARAAFFPHAERFAAAFLRDCAASLDRKIFNGAPPKVILWCCLAARGR